jgi:hypothetical protein
MPMRRDSAGTWTAALLTSSCASVILPACAALQARDGAQQGGFAAARRPDQDPDLSCLQAERHAVDRGFVSGRR